MTEDQMDARLQHIERLLETNAQMTNEVLNGPHHWHLKKEVTVAHILSSIGLVGIVIVAWFSLDSAVRVLDARTVNITDARITKVEAQVDNTSEHLRENFISISSQLAVISSKLDTLEERTIENRNRP